MIKRYEEGYEPMEESPNGEWVRYEDYNNLLRMYEHVLEQHNKLQEEAERLAQELAGEDL